MDWLLLLHQIPPKPPYFRAKVLRRLAQVGALPVKNSAYLLPDTEDTREDFEWICREITSEGGTAWLFRAESLAGLSAEQIEESFRRLRDADYEGLLSAAPEMEAAKFTQRFEEVKKIDFFEHPARAKVEALIAQRRSPEDGAAVAVPAGRLWVTRRGIKVDRIGSAWLIRRFIDPQAAFRFVDPDSYHHAAPELRFDMFDGEFTHEGDLCTFEVLVARHHLLAQQAALQPIAEIIHDLDLKDGRYERPETSGLARMLDGLCARTSDDRVRLEQGGQIFDAFFESFSA
jgi:hypothetical protein